MASNPFISKEKLERGVKGEIETYKTIHGVPVAFGYESTETGKDTLTAYIYNIPQRAVDKGYLAVRVSENGGSNPIVAEPTPREYVVGFDGVELSYPELEEVCRQTIEDTELDLMSLPTQTDTASGEECEETPIDCGMSEETETTQRVSVMDSDADEETHRIDLSDAFE